MNRAKRVAVLAGAAAVVGIIAVVIDADPLLANLAVLSAGIAIGELIVLHPIGRSPLPVSFAVFTVLVRAAEPWQVLIVVIAAELAAGCLRMGPMSAQERGGLFASVARRLLLLAWSISLSWPLATIGKRLEL